MSHEIPVFAFPIDCSYARSLSLDEALQLVPGLHWRSTSRNWWYQGLVKNLISAYADFEELRYLTEIVSVVPHDDLTARADAIGRLISAIGADTYRFIEANSWNNLTEEDLRANIEAIKKNIDEATVSRAFDDDSKYAFGNFFTFLASQAAALHEAKDLGKCLAYVQPQP